MYRMHMQKVSILAVLALSLTSSAANGMQKAEEKALSIAVAKIETVNCSSGFRTVVEDDLFSELHMSNLFILMDKSQMERIARKTGAADFDIGDPEFVAGQGKILKVDKIIVGSLLRNNGFLLTIRSIDTRTAVVDIVAREQFEDEAEVGAAVTRAAEKIKIFYVRYGYRSSRFALTLRGSMFFPAGVYAKYLYPAFSNGLILSVNNVGYENTDLFLSSGVSWFTPKTARYKDFVQIYSTVGISRRVYPFSLFQLSPRISAGDMWSRLNLDIDGKRGSNGFSYEKRNFHNFCVFSEIESSFYIYDRWMLSLAPGFMYILDRTNSGILFSVSAGVKTLF